MKNVLTLVFFLITIPVEAQQKNIHNEVYWFDKGKEDISHNELKAAIQDYTEIILFNPMDTQA